MLIMQDAAAHFIISVFAHSPNIDKDDDDDDDRSKLCHENNDANVMPLKSPPYAILSRMSVPAI
jgi:hypothetical protein